MGEKLELFDLDGLVRALNKQMAGDSLELGGYQELPSDDPDIALYGRYSILLTTYSTILGALFDIESDRNAGSLTVEKGQYFDFDYHKKFPYEAIMLRFTRPLELNGAVVRPANIHIWREPGKDCFSEIRKDYCSQFGVFKKSADLSSVLPSTLFPSRYERKAA